MSAAKGDRSAAPRGGTRPSRAKAGNDRAAPPRVPRAAGKPKPGERAMRDGIAARGAGEICDCGHAYEAHDGDECRACDCAAWAPRAVVGYPASPRAASVPAPGSPARDPVEGTTPAAVSPLSGAGSKPHEHLSPAEDDPPPPADPWWTPERERAFEMALQGAPQHQIARELARDRHTVARWVDDERFAGRLYEENMARFRASRQRRSMQTVGLTDKAHRLAGKMIDRALELAEEGEDNLGVRLAARDWLQEFRENSRREDEIYGLGKQRVDVSVHGEVQHRHKGKVEVGFRDFLTESLRSMGVDPDAEEIDAARAGEALIEVTERALGEGTFLADLAEREKLEQRLALESGR